MNYDYSSGYQASSNIPDDVAKGFALFAFGMFAFVMIFAIAVYLYVAICLVKIAKKTNTENAWFAWIPILNLILMIQIAKKPMWWIIMFFIPFVNLIFSILLWMAISEAVKKPSWIGILMIIPVANIIVPGYLAFSKMENDAIAAAPPVQPAV
ncbi:MAG: DUF5684 domain-containing protein [Parcubacteria group bacterium]|jgi:hypothetical protein